MGREETFEEFKKIATPDLLKVYDKVSKDTEFEIRILEMPNLFGDPLEKIFAIQILHKPTTTYKDIRFKMADVEKYPNVLEDVREKLDDFYNKWKFAISFKPIHIDKTAAMDLSEYKRMFLGAEPAMAEPKIYGKSIFEGKEMFVPRPHIKLDRELIAKMSDLYDNVIKELESRGEFKIDISKLVDILIQLRIVSPVKDEED